MQRASINKVAGAALGLLAVTCTVYPVVATAATQTSTHNIITNPSGGTFWLTTGWNLANGGQQSYLNTLKYEGNWAFQWGSELDTGDMVSYYPNVQNENAYLFSVKLAGTGKARLNVWNGDRNVSAPVINLTPNFQTEKLVVVIPGDAPGNQQGQAPQLQIVKEDSGSDTVYFKDASVIELGQGIVSAAAGTPNLNVVSNPNGDNGKTTGWDMAYSGSGASLSTASFSGKNAIEWQVQGNLGHADWVSNYPAVTDGNTYTFSVDVAGTGQAFLDVWDGSQDNATQPINLTSSYQTITLKVTIPTNAPGSQSGSAPQLQIRVPGTDPSTVYFRNASVVPAN